MAPGAKKTNSSKKQSDAFIKAARDLGCDEDEAKFNAALRRIGEAKPSDKPGALKESPDNERKKPGK